MGVFCLLHVETGENTCKRSDLSSHEHRLATTGEITDVLDIVQDAQEVEVPSMIDSAIFTLGQDSHARFLLKHAEKISFLWQSHVLIEINMIKI